MHSDRLFFGLLLSVQDGDITEGKSDFPVKKSGHGCMQQRGANDCFVFRYRYPYYL
jgi:hypothetical protein